MADHIRFVRDQHGQKNRPKRITNFNFVGSYSWVVEDPTNPSRSSWICVPGEAPMYMRNRANNEQLQKDTGGEPADMNFTCNPTCPTEPIFRVVDSAVLQNADLVTDRNNLRKLLGFATGKRKADAFSDGSFMIEAELVGSTIWLTRCPDPPLPFVGYGHSYIGIYRSSIWKP